MKLLKHLLPELPNDIRVFYDWACGTGSVFLNVKAHAYLINDIYQPLIALHIQTRTDEPLRFLHTINTMLAQLDIKNDTESFERLRDMYNADPNPWMLFVLMTMTHANMYRWNKKGEFNAYKSKDGRFYGDRYIQRYADVFSAMQQRFYMTFFARPMWDLPLTGIEDLLSDFNLDTPVLGPQDLIYVDPPYLVSQHPWQWGIEEEQKLLAHLLKAHKQGIRFALSNILDNGKQVNELLEAWITEHGFNTVEMPNTYTRAYKHRGRQRKEVLVTNYAKPVPPKVSDLKLELKVTAPN